MQTIGFSIIIIIFKPNQNTLICGFTMCILGLMYVNGPCVFLLMSGIDAKTKTNNTGSQKVGCLSRFAS